MEKQTELIGGGLGAGGTIGRQVGLPRFDVVFRHAAPAVDIFIEGLRLAAFEIGHDETGVCSLLTNLDPGDDALDPAPAFGAIIELLEASEFLRL